MQTTRRRMAMASTGMLLALGVATFGLLGLGAFFGGGTSNLEVGVLEVAELGICVDAGLFDASAAPDPACDSCPKRIPGEPCTRVSCDPCCYRCSGEPVLRCY